MVNLIPLRPRVHFCRIVAVVPRITGRRAAVVREDVALAAALRIFKLALWWAVDKCIKYSACYRRCAATWSWPQFRLT